MNTLYFCLMQNDDYDHNKTTHKKTLHILYQDLLYVNHSFHNSKKNIIFRRQ